MTGTAWDGGASSMASPINSKSILYCLLGMRVVLTLVISPVGVATTHFLWFGGQSIHSILQLVAIRQMPVIGKSHLDAALQTASYDHETCLTILS
jgi:hypothetical protein